MTESHALSSFVDGDRSPKKAYEQLHHYRIFLDETGCHEVFAQSASAGTSIDAVSLDDTRRWADLRPAETGAMPRIVASGSPMHNVAPCGACHGAIDYKTGSPWLAGEPFAYLKVQLAAFASGARHNDISQQMRNVARGMSEAETSAAAKYYAEPP